MRIGVIRSDLPSPLRLVDLEPVSQYNPPTEPRGQERYLARPSTTTIEKILASSTTGVGAVIQGSNISSTFPLTLNGTNNVLRLKTSAAASYTAVTIPAAAYANMAALVAAVQTVVAGLGIAARAGVGTGSFALESTTRGVNSYLSVDTTGNGSTANTPLGLTAGARTVAPASAFILAGNPLGGPIDVRTATLNAVGATTATNTLGLIPASRGTTAAVQDALAPLFADTDAAVDSYLVGMLSEYRSSRWNPDPRRIPALTSGAAIAVVADDGNTAYAATLPTLTNAVLTGRLALAGTGLGSSESEQTTVKLAGAVNRVLSQAAIVAAGGAVSDTAIMIPASLLTGVTTTTTTVQVKVRQRASNVRAIA